MLPYTYKCGHLHCGDCMRGALTFVGDTTRVSTSCYVCSAVSEYPSLKAVPVNMEWAEAVDSLRCVTTSTADVGR